MQRTREKWRLALYLSMRVATSTKSLHLFSDSKQRTKLKTANSAGTLFKFSPPVLFFYFYIFLKFMPVFFGGGLFQKYVSSGGSKGAPRCTYRYGPNFMAFHTFLRRNSDRHPLLGHSFLISCSFREIFQTIAWHPRQRLASYYLKNLWIHPCPLTGNYGSTTETAGTDPELLKSAII